MKKQAQRTALLIAGVIATALGAGYALVSCWPEPEPVVRPKVVEATPVIRNEASASVLAHTTAATRLTVRKPAKAQNGTQTGQAGSSSDSSGAGLSSQEDEFVIEIETIATSAATASAGAVSTLESDTYAEHARIGVIVATIPGVFAFDALLLKADIPPWLLGKKLTVGIDAQLNFQQIGVGISAGDKAFATGGAYTTYDLKQQGIYLGVGMRF